jgi:hypothetical protein
MRWIAAPKSSTMDTVLIEQVESLRNQMASSPPEPSVEESAGGPTIPPWMKIAAGRFRRS